MFSYRSTPNTTTGVSPSELLFGHHIRTHLDLLWNSTVPPCSDSDILCSVEKSQNRQKWNHDSSTKTHPVFAPGDSVYVRNYFGKIKWISGVVEQVKGPLTYSVHISGNKLIKCHHIDQLCLQVSTLPATAKLEIQEIPEAAPQPEVHQPALVPAQSPPALHRSARVYKAVPPDWYSLVPF